MSEFVKTLSSWISRAGDAQRGCHFFAPASLGTPSTTTPSTTSRCAIFRSTSVTLLATSLSATATELFSSSVSRWFSKSPARTAREWRGDGRVLFSPPPLGGRRGPHVVRRDERRVERVDVVTRSWNRHDQHAVGTCLPIENESVRRSSSVGARRGARDGEFVLVHVARAQRERGDEIRRDRFVKKRVVRSRARFQKHDVVGVLGPIVPRP